MRAVVRLLFPRRIHRLSYFIRLVICNVLGAPLFVGESPFERPLVLVCSLALAVYALCFVLLPRLRDVGMSGLWLIVAFIPVANIILGIILLFRPPEYHFGETFEDGPQKV